MPYRNPASAPLVHQRRTANGGRNRLRHCRCDQHHCRKENPCGSSGHVRRRLLAGEEGVGAMAVITTNTLTIPVPDID